MFKFKELVEANMDALAHLLSSEHGKVIADAKGDIQRGLEVIEFACGIPHALKGEYTQGAGPASTSIRCASRSASSPASRRSTSRR
jgi:malonate-semialdehyde dehydrogenase (acetylating)/methylmalonate-semialdehyde dehydrogenase